MKSKMECLLASIFLRFCSVWGANLAPKTRQEPSKIASKSSVNFNMSSGAFLERLGAKKSLKINLTRHGTGSAVYCYVS